MEETVTALKATPTVMEISTFMPEIVKRLQRLFVNNISQPSFISRAIVINGATDREIGALTLAVQAGVLAKLEFRRGYASGSTPVFMVSFKELSPCCGADFISRTANEFSCRTCRTALKFKPIDIHFDRNHDDDGEPLGYNLDGVSIEFQRRLEESDIDIFDALILGQEVQSLIYDVIQEQDSITKDFAV